MHHKSKSLTLFVLLLYFASIFVVQISQLFELPYENWMREVHLLYSYALVALLIWINREYLADFHIDKLSLIIFFLFGAVLRTAENGLSPSLQCVLTSLVLAIAGSLFVGLRKSRVQIVCIPKIGLWTLAAVFAGLGMMLPLIAIAGILLGQLPGFSLGSFGVFGLYFLSNLGSIAIPEETFFRGFLWGYLRDHGLSDKCIWLIQIVLFSLGHFGTNPFVFLCKAPVVAFVAGYFVLKTRSVAPGMILHACVNALGDSVGYYIN